MRITSGMIFRTAQANIQKQAQRLFEVQEQAAAGKGVIRPSDDPVSARLIMSRRGTLQSIEQFKENTGILNSLLGVSEGVLGEIGGLLSSAKERALAGVNGSASALDRQSIALEVAAKHFGQMIALGNTDVDGRHIFGGRVTDTPPLAALIAVETGSSGLQPSGTIAALTAGDLTINDIAVPAAVAGNDTLSTSDNAAGAIALAAAINSVTPSTGVRAKASTTLSLSVAAYGNLAAGDLTINGVAVTGAITNAASLVAVVNAANIPGVQAYSNGPNDFSLMAADGRNIQLQTTGAAASNMSFTSFDLNGGAALDQTSTGVVTLHADDPFTIAGSNPGRARLLAGLKDSIRGGRYTGDSSTIDMAMSSGQKLAANIPGADFLVSDLRLNINGSTLLADLHLGQGITAGSINITDRAGTAAVVNLAAATTVQDVLNTINAAATNVTASINVAGNGITLTDNNATPIQNLIVTEVGAGTTASELGILANRPGNIVGTPLDPRVTFDTPLSLLHAGQGLTLGSVHIENGALKDDINLATATTIGDVILALRASVAKITADVNPTTTAIEVRSIDPATVAIVADTGSTTTAADLGIQGPHDFLKTLSLLHEALDKNDPQAIQNLLTPLDEGIDRAAQLSTTLGARLNRIDIANATLDNLDFTMTELLSQAEDADALEVFSRLSNVSAAFEAALATTIQVVQPRLLDFLQ